MAPHQPPRTSIKVPPAHTSPGAARHRILRWIRALAAALCVGSTVPAITAAADPVQANSIQFVIPTGEELELAFEPSGEGSLAATATVGISNNSVQEARVEFHMVDVDSGNQVGSEVDPEAVSLAAPILVVEPGRVAIGRITVTAPATTTSVDAVLVAEAPGIGASAIPVSITGNESPFAEAEAIPASKTLTLSRALPSLPQRYLGCWWSWPPSDAADWKVPLEGLGDVRAATAVDKPQAYLSSDTGGTLLVSLAEVDQPGGIGGRLEVGCADRAGVYTGNLEFDSAEDANALELTINVQDFFLWPLLAVGLGSYATWLFKKRTDRTRPQQVLRIAIEEARKRYLESRQGASGLLDDIIDPTVELPGGRGEAASLYRSVGTARTQEEHDDLTSEVESLVTLVELTPAIVVARAKLRDQIESGPLAELPDARNMRAAATVLLDKSSLDSLDDAKAHHAALKSQVAAGVEWLRANALCDYVEDRYARLPNPLPAGLAEHVLLANPVAIRVTYLRPASSLADLTAPSVVGLLRERLVTIEAAREARPATPPPTGARGGPAADVAVRSILAGIPMPFLPGGTTTEQKLAWIRLGDGIEFVVVALVAALVFLESAYVGQAFGTLWQYVAAFATGAAGTWTINFALLPWYRSYRVGSSGAES
jgi:hypothetical protein